jgi:hypothetical protein
VEQRERCHSFISSRTPHDNTIPIIIICNFDISQVGLSSNVMSMKKRFWAYTLNALLPSHELQYINFICAWCTRFSTLTTTSQAKTNNLKITVRNSIACPRYYVVDKKCRICCYRSCLSFLKY